jgi:hypothetical protein
MFVSAMEQRLLSWQSALITCRYPQLPSRLVLELNNCYCIPTLSKNIISSSCLEEVDGYEIVIKNKCCSIYYNDILYTHCPLVNGLYVLDLEDKPIYNINAKRFQPNDLNPTFIGIVVSVLHYFYR